MSSPTDPDDIVEVLALTADRPRPDVLVVRVVGELDMITAPRLTAYLASAVGAGVRHLALDVSAVTFLGSHGISALVALRDNEAGHPARIHLIGARDNPRVRRVLDIVALTATFSDHPTVADLIARIDPV
ncbi:STAS domain-containing protein [Pseudonocardia sp. GCM10023141]|uniref:STAS domain-containing protein n=1 Tax=Pseudonocardia sp. GCM10023141 TaxID=3252653 RepID=UPI00361BA754